jgi:hypothetical protein
MLNASSQSLTWLTLNQRWPKFGPDLRNYQIRMSCDRLFASVALTQKYHTVERAPLGTI